MRFLRQIATAHKERQITTLNSLELELRQPCKIELAFLLFQG